jgi:hypothetical protein
MDDTVDMVYVGDPPVLDEITRFMLATGQIHPEAAAVLRGAEVYRSTAIPGIDKRLVDPEYFGTSRQYVFGPVNFTVAVEKRDVDKIKGSTSGHQFKVVGDPMEDFVLPEPGLRIIDEIEVGATEGTRATRSDLQKLFR